MKFGDEAEFVKKLEDKLHIWENLVGEQRNHAVRMRSWLNDWFASINDAGIPQDIQQNIYISGESIRELLCELDKHDEILKECLRSLFYFSRTSFVYAPPEVSAAQTVAERAKLFK